jgi:glutaredoxin
MAKNLLNQKGIGFTEVRVDLDSHARQFLIEQGHRSVPQIYQNNQLLENGYAGLCSLNDSDFQRIKDIENVG